MALQVIAGLLYALSFKPIGIWFFAPVAIALQIYLLRRFRYPELQSFLFAFTSSLIILSWSKTFVGVLPWFSLAFLQGLIAIPIGAVARLTKKIPPLIFITLVMEEVRSRFPFGGFSWTRIAYSQIDSPFSSLVSYIGMAGLSLVTLLLAATFLTRSKSYALVLFILFATTFSIPNPPENGNAISIRAIQGGVPERGLNFNARAEAVLDNHIKVTEKEFTNSDELIIWPENAIDIDPIQNSTVAEKLISLAERIKTPLLAGAILDDEELYNSTILFDEFGNPKSTYIKRYLTPFGEYIPLRVIASIFSPHVDRVTDFSPGTNSVVHQLAKTKIGSIICYELLNDGIVRQAAVNSDFLVVHTNSATFSGSSEGEQQLAITRLRAIESGKSVVSISTTGPSAVIDARGVVLQKLGDGVVGSLSGEIQLNNSKSIVHSLGGLHTVLVLLFTLFWAIFSIFRRESDRGWRGRS